MTTPAVRMWYALLVSFMASVVIAASCLIWTATQQAESDARWCRLMTALDDAYRANPPTSPAGQQIAAEIHSLRRSLGCDGRKE